MECPGHHPSTIEMILYGTSKGPAASQPGRLANSPAFPHTKFVQVILSQTHKES